MKRKTKPLLIASSLWIVVCAEPFALAGEAAVAGERLKKGQAVTGSVTIGD